MQSLDEVLAEGAARRQRALDNVIVWRRTFHRFVRRVTISGVVLGIAYGCAIGLLLRSGLAGFGVFIGTVAAAHVSARWLPGMVAGMGLLGGGAFAGMGIGLGAGSLAGVGGLGAAGGIGFFLALLFTIASWPLVGGLFGLWTGIWHDDHLQMRSSG